MTLSKGSFVVSFTLDLKYVLFGLFYIHNVGPSSVTILASFLKKVHKLALAFIIRDSACKTDTPRYLWPIS